MLLWRFSVAVFGLLICQPNSSSLAVRSALPSNGTQPPVALDMAPGYRISVAQAKRPTNRVPSHLQDIHHGLVYNDADDVIHIIEPPQRFQHMKRLIHQKGDSTPWTLTPASVASVASGSPSLPAMKAKDVAKVDRSVWQKPPIGGDLMAQTSKLQQQFAVPQHLPMQILASVRNTERLLQKPHRSYHLPYAKQRLKMRKIQTVLMENRYEREKAQHAKQWSLGGIELAKRDRRVRRSSPTAYSSDRGLELLRNIDVLLKNASAFLPTTEFGEEPPKYTQLIGEIEPSGDAKVLNELLTNSLNATDTMLGKFMRKRNLIRANTTNAQIAECEQQQQRQSPINATSSTHLVAGTIKIDCLNRLLAQAPTPRFGARLRSKSNPLQMLTNEQMSGESASQRHSKHATAAATNEPSLLYADVMTNIRNLEAALHDPEAAWFAANETALRPPKAIADTENATQLSGYLQELQRIVAHLSPSPALTTFDKISADPTTAAQPSSSKQSPESAWYVINGEGEIFGTNLTSESPANVSVFHRFPDIPNAGLYISNRTFAGDGNGGSTIEILTP